MGTEGQAPHAARGMEAINQASRDGRLNFTRPLAARAAAPRLRPHATFGDDPSGYCGYADCDEREAESGNLEDEVDRVRERLWRLAALAGWRPGNPADNDATAELYVTEALRTRVFPPGAPTTGGATIEEDA